MNFNCEEDAERIEGLLGRYVEQRIVDGVEPDPEELCRDSPEMLTPLREHIREYEQLNRILAPPEVPVAGKSLLHYRIVEKIGEGGMGQVYLAEDSKLGRRVALKVLPPEMAADRERFQRFRREARLVAGLNHPNIVTLHTIEQDGEVDFLVMELVEGQTLGELIAGEALSLDRFLAIAVPLADALADAHERGVIRRAVLPDEVLAVLYLGSGFEPAGDVPNKITHRPKEEVHR